MPDWSTSTSRQSCPLGQAAVAPHSRSLPAYQAGPGANWARIAEPAHGAGSLLRPARTTSAPASRAAMNGSGPIMPTMRSARSTVDASSASHVTQCSNLARREPILDPALVLARSGSGRAGSAGRSSRAISATIPATLWRCGSPPAPPQLPMISGIRPLARGDEHESDVALHRPARVDGLARAEIVGPGVGAAPVDPDHVRFAGEADPERFLRKAVAEQTAGRQQPNPFIESPSRVEQPREARGQLTIQV